MNPMKKYWPMPNSSPRKTQEKVFEWIANLPPSVKYILCEVPVGGGKSPIALTVSGWFAQSMGSAIILTPQRILQKQYEDSFESKRLASMYGRSNYECKPKRTNCEIGGKVKPACKSCPQAQAYAVAKAAPNLVLNYTIGLIYSMLDMDAFKERKLLVFDECHTLEHHLTEFYSVTVSERMSKKYKVAWKPVKTLAEAMYFLEEAYYPAVKSELMRLTKLVEEINNGTLLDGGPISKQDMETIEEHDSLLRHAKLIEMIMVMPEPQLLQNYVLVSDKTYFKFKELFGKKVFADLLEHKAERFLFMSSTILDKDAYCRDLGLDPSKAAFISLESEFEEENRPVIFMPKAKMTYGWDGPDRADDRKQMLDAVIGLCKENHPEHNGIVHTGSFQVAAWLIKEIEGKIPHRIYHHNPGSDRNRDEVITAFTDDDFTGPKILISPSITEGLDLKGDKGRFAIFAKTPYPFLGDAWVKRRMEMSQEWYSRQAMIGVIQGGGRVTRAHDDWGYTYILDSAFGQLYRSMQSKLPKWWKDAFQTIQ